MFDVIWTDHNRELVGERRARKGIERDGKRKDDSQSIRSSTPSTASSGSTHNDKPFSFFGGLGRKKTVTGHPSANTATLGDVDVARPLRERRSSRLRTPASARQEDAAFSVDTNQSYYPINQSYNSSQDTPDRSSRGGKTFSPICPYWSLLIVFTDSIFSRWTEQTMPTPSLMSGASSETGCKSQIIQSLGPSSYVQQTTEVSVEPRTPNEELDRFSSDVIISAGGVNHRPLTPMSPQEL
jgi:hypothetical protein